MGFLSSLPAIQELIEQCGVGRRFACSGMTTIVG